MAVRVVEERHPEVVILHGRDEVRLAGEGDPANTSGLSGAFVFPSYARALACAENIRAKNPTDLAISVSFTRLIWKATTALCVTHAPPGISSI